VDGLRQPWCDVNTKILWIRARPTHSRTMFVGAIFVVGLAFAYLMFSFNCARSSTPLPSRPDSLVSLLSITSKEIAQADIIQMNLLCAQGLTGSETVDTHACLGVLDQMIARVKSEIQRHEYRIRQNPAEFENSEGYFKMLMLGVVLAEDFKVHYVPEKRVDPSKASMNDGFFADSRRVFLTGLLGPEREGTCSSVPVLYVVERWSKNGCNRFKCLPTKRTGEMPPWGPGA
jgi:hypothetical protein